MINDKINIFINSKNRNNGDTSSFYVKIPDGLLKLYNRNEYFTLNVISFSCINSWYNCIYDFNDTFYITIKDQNDILIGEEIGRIPEGNPNVLYLKDYLTESLGNIVDVFYDVLKNKWEFKKLTSINEKVFIRIKNSEDFLGFTKDYRDIDMEITVEGLKSVVPINMMGDESFSIKVDGNIGFHNNNIDNYLGKEFVPSSIIFNKSIDAPPYSIIKYNNEDAGDSFQFILSNKTEIEGFQLTVINQDGEIIPNFSEYTLGLQFIRYTIETETLDILKNILDLIRQIYFIIGRSMTSSLKENKTKKK